MSAPTPSTSMDPTTPPELEQEPEPELRLPSYTPSATLPPAYTTHRSDRLLLSSSSDGLGQQPEGEDDESTTSRKQPLFSLTGHIRLKIHSPLHLLHRFLFFFLLLNTALFALLVYNVQENELLGLPDAADLFCPCPLPHDPQFMGVGNTPGTVMKVKVNEECYDFLNAGVGVLSNRQYEKLGVWKECIEEVGQAVQWRMWVLKVLMPAMCVVETALAVAWWWCLRQVDKLGAEEEGGGEEGGGVLGKGAGEEV
ncbi:hypothetical protein TWF718_010584 [Orbilia javanica]|uniref:Uncharacterized protein n=1 Tax=Orbilia javanica TaxID=47235 RepID=A0AAN8MUN8_9PEZI